MDCPEVLAPIQCVSFNIPIYNLRFSPLPLRIRLKGIGVGHP
jgi:hypothetical protein